MKNFTLVRYARGMHIFFSGIGGAGIGPLALIAKQAGYQVSGSDKQESQYTKSLQDQGITLHIGQSKKQIESAHAKHPIDWLVYSSAVPKENPNHPELVFAKEHGITHSKRDELLNRIIQDNNLKLVAIAGTHGKTTTTAMAVWLCKQVGLPISYSVGAKLPFGPAGEFIKGSNYFVYECDEYDRNFLAFKPYLSLVTGISWDHHDVFPTAKDYRQAFLDFIRQSKRTILWQQDFEQLELADDDKFTILDQQDKHISNIQLPGDVNRQDAWQVVHAVHLLTGKPLHELTSHMNRFPGASRRMEQLAPGIYTDYAHTPEKIKGSIKVAVEIATKLGKKVVAVYEPHSNYRQHFIKEQYGDSFVGVSKLYWLPSYRARGDDQLPPLEPKHLIEYLPNKHVAEPAVIGDILLQKLHQHAKNGDIIVAMGAGSSDVALDEWLRQHLQEIVA